MSDWWQQPGQFYNALLRPFDPKTMQPRDIGLGGPSTEYTATAQDQNGLAFNYPTIWWDQNGNPVLLSGDAAYNMAMDWEARTNMLAPRYDTMGAAEFFAQNRSALGGAETSPMFSVPRRK